MRQITFVLLAVLFFAGPARGQKVEPAPLAGGEPCEREVDEFTGVASYTCPSLSLEVEKQPSEQIYGAKGLLLHNDGSTFFLITTYSDSWNFLSVETAYTLLDGKRAKFALQSVNREVNGGRVYEQNAIQLSSKDLQRLAEVTEFRMKVGLAVFGVPVEDLAEQVSFMADL